MVAFESWPDARKMRDDLTRARWDMLHDRDEHHRQRSLTMRRRKALGDLFSGPYRY